MFQHQASCDQTIVVPLSSRSRKQQSISQQTTILQMVSFQHAKPPRKHREHKKQALDQKGTVAGRNRRATHQHTDEKKLAQMMWKIEIKSYVYSRDSRCAKNVRKNRRRKQREDKKCCAANDNGNNPRSKKEQKSNNKIVSTIPQEKVVFSTLIIRQCSLRSHACNERVGLEQHYNKFQLSSNAQVSNLYAIAYPDHNRARAPPFFQTFSIISSPLSTRLDKSLHH